MLFTSMCGFGVYASGSFPLVLVAYNVKASKGPVDKAVKNLNEFISQYSAY